MVDTTTTTTVNPWAPQGDALKYGYGEAQKTYKANMLGGPLPWATAGTNALTEMQGLANETNPFLSSAQGAVTGTAGMDPGGGYLQQGMFGDIAQGEMIGANPYRSAALNDALDQTQDRIKASMSGAGRYGSGAYGNAMARGLGGVAADFNLNAYNSDLDRSMAAASSVSQEQLARQGMSLQAAGMAPAMDDFRYADAERLAGVGAAQDSRNQQDLNFDNEQLARMVGMFGTIPGSAGTGTGTVDTPDQPWWQTLLGGIGAGLGSIGGMFK